MKLLMRYGVKLGAVAGTVYYTNKVGLWDDSDRAYELYKEAYQFAVPYLSDVKKEIPLPEVQLPTTDCASRTLKNYWNKGVVSSIDFLLNLPSNTMKLGCQTYSYISKQLEETSSEGSN